MVCTRYSGGSPAGRERSRSTSPAGLRRAEAALFGVVEELGEDHPVLEKFKKFGLIVDFDEKEAIDAMGRVACGCAETLGLTITPTMGCNFDCPYCFENHLSGRMSKETQDDVVALAEKMMDAYGSKSLSVVWYGGEPLLAPGIIEDLTVRLRELPKARGGDYTAHIITNGYFLDAKNIALLDRCGVTLAQVTLDGVGEMHDRTRRLAGGGPTFERIAANLSENKIPFRVDVRHNVYTDNLDQIEPLRAFVHEMAQKSGNDLTYYATHVHDNDVMEARGNLVDRLESGDKLLEISLRMEAGRYRSKNGAFCSANRLASLGVDDKGLLYKCWENMDKPERSFGHASTWDPRDPIRTAEHRDMLTRYLNTCCPTRKAECEDCLWLPLCCGGCPEQRVAGRDPCFPFKDHPEEFAMAVYQALAKKGQSQKEQSQSEQGADLLC